MELHTDPAKNDPVYRAIAANLREFGYPDVTGAMVREVHESMLVGGDLPHGVVGMFAKGQLEELWAMS